MTLTNTYPTSLSDLVVKENGLRKNTERAISQSLGRSDVDDDDDDTSSSSDDEDDSDDESPREKLANRNMRRIPNMPQNGATSKEDERYFERTAMRLLKRTASGDGKLTASANRRRRDSATESDSEYSSASSELEGAFLAQSELMRKTAQMALGSHQKHAPIIHIPKPVYAASPGLKASVEGQQSPRLKVESERSMDEAGCQDTSEVSESDQTPRNAEEFVPGIDKHHPSELRSSQIGEKTDVPKVQIVQPLLKDSGNRGLVDGNGNDASQTI